MVCWAIAIVLAVLPFAVSAASAKAGGAFQGSWRVQWCPAGRSDGDCGGLSVVLFQSGDTLCGTYSGASPGLDQVDDGEPDAIVGQAVGRVAVLAVRGGRSGEVRLVRAQLKGAKLHWRVLHSVSPPIDDARHDDTIIIGSNDLLAKAPQKSKSPNAQCLRRFGIKQVARVRPKAAPGNFGEACVDSSRVRALRLPGLPNLDAPARDAVWTRQRRSQWLPGETECRHVQAQVAVCVPRSGIERPAG